MLGSTYRELASVFAQCSGIARNDSTLTETVREETAERYAPLAVNLLVIANDLGYFTKPEQAADLRTDDRLKPILNRDEFRTFQLELEKSLTAKDRSIEQSK